MHRIASLIAALALLAGCHKMDNPGSAQEQFEDGLIHQVSLSDEPIPTSDARLKALGRDKPVARPTRKPTPTPAPVATPAPTEPPPVAVVDPAVPAPTPTTPSPAQREDDALAEQIAAEAAAQKAEQAAVLAGSPLSPTPTPTPTPEPEPEGDDDDSAAEPEADEPTAEEIAAAEEAAEVALPEAPESDLDALVALASATAGEEAAEQLADGPLELQQCEPAEPSQLRENLRDMSLIRAWAVDGRMRAEVEVAGELVVVVQGDRLGPDGGRVVRISRDEVLVGEIGFDLNGEAGIFTRPIRAR